MRAHGRFYKSLIYLLEKNQAPKDDLSTVVLKAQQALLYRQLLLLTVMPMVTSTLVVISLVTLQPPLPVIAWYLAYIGIPCTLLILFITKRKKIRTPETSAESKPNFQGNLMRASEKITTISGFFWGITVPLFGVESEEILVFMAIVQITHACGFGQLIAALPRMVFRFTSLTLIPVSIMLILRPSILLTTLGLLALAVFASIMISSFKSYQQLQTIAHSEARARLAETLLRSSIDAMPNALSVHAFDGELILENTKHKAWTFDYVIPSTITGEQIVQTEDGRWIQNSWNLVPEIGTLMLHTDITTHKHREVQLIEAREQAQRATGAQSRFVSRISHELRTPLNSVLGFSELLIPISQKQKSWSTVQEYVQYIHSSGQHLLSLVDDIIDYTSIGDEADKVSIGIVDLERTLSHASEIGRAKAGTLSSHKILLRLHPNLSHLKTDRRILERILANIIANAVKFSPPDSKIAISSSYNDDGHPVITVRDFGPGMAPQQIASAFTAFYQGDETHKRSSDGTGIGLALVKKLGALLNIEVQLASKPGRGTAVILTFEKSSALQNTCDVKDNVA